MNHRNVKGLHAKGSDLHPQQQGAAALEFVLILIPVLLLLCAIVSYASYFLLQQRVNHTVGDVARMVSVQRVALDPDNQTAFSTGTDSYKTLIRERLSDDGWLHAFKDNCDAAQSLCHRTAIESLDCDWFPADAVAVQHCVRVSVDVEIEGWFLTDLLRHVGRTFSDSANWVPTVASASVVVRLQNNR